MLFSVTPFPGHQEKTGLGAGGKWRTVVSLRRSANGRLALPGPLPVFRVGTKGTVRKNGGQDGQAASSYAPSSLVLFSFASEPGF